MASHPSVRLQRLSVPTKPCVRRSGVPHPTPDGKLRLTAFSDQPKGQNDLHSQAVSFEVWAGTSDLPRASPFSYFPTHPQDKETHSLSGNNIPVNLLYCQPMAVKIMPLLRQFYLNFPIRLNGIQKNHHGALPQADFQWGHVLGPPG